MNLHPRQFRFCIVLLAAACGSSSTAGSNTSSALSHFIGNWAATVHTTLSCGDSVGQGDPSITITLVAGSGADLESASDDGCVFKFRVSGNTATLSNAPVSCNAAFAGLRGTTTVNDYTLTTSDGHHASTSRSGTMSVGPDICTLTIVGSATK